MGLQDSDSDSDEDSDLSEIMGLGGLGTSFDDEYADNIASYSFLESYGDPQSVNNDESLHERLEWRAMLASVLTGDVVTSEKRRLKTGGAIMKEDDLWMGIRARICNRTLEAQKQITEERRSAVDDILQEVMQFKVSDSTNFDLCRQEVHDVLDKIEQCETLWTSTQALKANSAIYSDSDFQLRLKALNTWVNITDRVNEQVELLRRWAGNPGIDPRLPSSDTNAPAGPMTEITLADRILTKKDPQEIFRNKMEQNIEPVVKAARDGLSKYGGEMRSLGLPIQREGLQVIISFLMVLIHEIIRSRLVFSKRMVNPTTMLIDQTVKDISSYLGIASMIKERTASYIESLPNDAEWVDFQPDPEFDNSILECIEYFFELSQTKLLDTPIHHYGRGFKDIESLENQYVFLDHVAKRIKDGRIVVAIRASALASRMVTNMHRYWERQTKGPLVYTSAELQRWQSATTEQVRKAQRKLLRFYQ